MFILIEFDQFAWHVFIRLSMNSLHVSFSFNFNRFMLKSPANDTSFFLLSIVDRTVES